MPDLRKLSLSCSILLVLPLAMGVATDEPPAPAGEAEAVQAAAQSPRTAGAGVDWIDDARLTTLMAQGATRLIEAGRAPEMEAVKAGLATGSCRLDLPREHQKADNPAAHADHPPAEPRIDSATLYEQARPAVAVVGGAFLCGRCDNWHVGGATGFFLTEDGALVTNYHVIDQEDRRGMFVMTADGRVFPITATLAADRDADVAIVQVEPIDQDGRPATFQTLPLAERSRVGQSVRVISHPDGRHYTLTEGIVSRKYTSGRRGGTGGTRWITITADYARGSSGGPLLDEAGRVIGIVASTASVYYDRDDERGPQNLQMVWKQSVPVENIRALLEE